MSLRRHGLDRLPPLPPNDDIPGWVVAVAATIFIVLVLTFALAAVSHAQQPAQPPQPTQAEQAVATINADLKTLVAAINLSLRALNDDMIRLKAILDAERPKAEVKVEPPPPTAQQ